MISVAQTFDMASRHHQAGRLQQADYLYRQVLQADPQHVGALHMAGVLACQVGRYDVAAAHIQEALRLQPDFAEAHSNLGNALRNLGKLDEAAASYRESIRLKPGFAAPHNNLGNVLVEQGKIAEAIACFEQALRLDPNLAFAHRNRGVALSYVGRLEEAVASIEHALRLNPHDAEAVSNLGNAVADQGKFDEAAVIYERALRLQPDCALAHWGLGMIRLRQGNYEQGWPECEWRVRCPEIKPPPYGRPTWDGSFLAGRTILLYAEQGQGDTLQFVRYASMVQARGGRILLACPHSLLRLFSSCPGIDRLVPFGTELPADDYDVQASLMSLPAIFKTTLETVPANVPYVFADAALKSHWRHELQQYPTHHSPVTTHQFKIGISWQGNPQYRKDYRRSMPLTQFAPLGRLSGVQLFSLQKGPGCEQLADLTDRFSVIDLGSRLRDFADTAAVMANLDLVITSDSAPAHLAGALGVPVWVALASVSDWRWLLDREDSPWYPTMRLFRQSEPGNWEEVFERMAEALRRRGEGEKGRKGESETPLLPFSLSPLLPLCLAQPITQTFRMALQNHQAGHFEQAESLYRQVLQADPEHVDALHLLGVLACQTGRAGVGVDSIREALRLKPDWPEAYANLGSCYGLQGKLAEAVDSYRQVLRLEPSQVQGHVNLGTALTDQGKPEESAAVFQQALRLQADCPQAHWGLGIARLVQGDFEQGWPDFEWRLRCKEINPPPFQRPLWDGSPLNGRAILLYMEQGLGDTLQFIRFAPMVQARGGPVLLACQHELLRLLAGCPGVDRLLPYETALPIADFDVQASLLSLPAIFKTTLTTLPAKVPYVFADAMLTERWRERLTQYPTHHSPLTTRDFKIGIAWQGNPIQPKDYRRSIPLSQFAPLAHLPGVQLFSLQKGHGSEQLPGLAEQFSIIDLSGHLYDFADTAAVMRNLDLVITCDSAPAHLAGALGVPVWAALPHVADWRWLTDRQDCPWYPTMRLFRQSEPGNWDAVFERMAAEIRSRGEGENGRGGERDVTKGQSGSPSPPLPFSPSPISSPLFEMAERHHEAGRLREADSLYRQILQADPHHPQALHMQGVLACQVGQFDAGIPRIREALRLDPHLANGPINLGTALADHGELEEARDIFQQLLRRQPDCAPAHWDLGMIRLLQGNFEQGWPEYEWRLKCKQFPPPPYGQPIWDGSPLAGRTILLYAEQGLGDVVQYIRYAPLVQAMGGRVHVACQPALLRVLSACRGIDRLLPFGSPLANSEFDVQASLLSLPAILKTTLATVPAEVPYVFADAALVERWRQETGAVFSREPLASAAAPPIGGAAALARGSRLNIGIVWQGDPRHRKDYRRSIPLACFAPLARLPGVQLFSLQKGPGSEQLRQLAEPFSVIDLGGHVEDFADTAAVMRNLDLVITCDSAPAHLAGALGVPVWVALPSVADWRWMLKREDSPWYPTMRLFRQNKPGNWDEVCERMAKELGRGEEEKGRGGEGERGSTGDEEQKTQAGVSFSPSPLLPFSHSSPVPATHHSFELALQYHKAGQLEEADCLYRQILQAEPRHLKALHMAGVLACQNRRFDAGIAYIREALRLKPDSAEAHCNLGNAFQDQGRGEEALACYRQSLELKPLYLEAHFNVGNVLTDQGKHDEAIARYQHILDLQPDFAHAHRGLGTTWLLQGKLEQGWPEYEWRLQCSDVVPPPYRQSIWDGSPLKGRTILLYTEQGLGDTLHFIRYAPLVQATGGRVLVACQAALVKLLAGCRGIDRLMPFGTALPTADYDVQAPLMSLPAILKTSLATIPADVPYVFADAALTERWRIAFSRELLASAEAPPAWTDARDASALARGSRLNIGIAWQGNPTYRRDFRRSFRLAQLAPLARVAGVQLFSLQKGAGSEQLAGVADKFSVIELGSRLADLTDTAAVMRNLDLVITCDSAPAHLAGALGVPVWVALSHVPDWRWLLDRQDSPWYPTMRLFRQSVPGNWEDVFASMAAELAHAR